MGKSNKNEKEYTSCRKFIISQLSLKIVMNRCGGPQRRVVTYLCGEFTGICTTYRK